MRSSLRSTPCRKNLNDDRDGVETAKPIQLSHVDEWSPHREVTMRASPGEQDENGKLSTRQCTKLLDQVLKCDCGPFARLLTPLINPPELKLCCGIVGD